MTDGVEETPSGVDDSSDSQGSVNEILSTLMQENVSTGFPIYNFTGLQDCWQENSPEIAGDLNLQEVSEQNEAAVVTCPIANERTEENLFPVKSEDVTAGQSPDSGYDYAYSNESQRNNGNQIPAMYEIPAQPIGINAARSNWPGSYGFHAVFDHQDHVPKSANYTYSTILDKLFVKMNTTICMQFKCQCPAPPTANIRAMLLFQKPEHMHETVCRCQTHLFQANASDIAHHVLQIQETTNEMMRNTVYGFSGGRFDVSVSVDPQLGGNEAYMVPYVFTCLSTCIGGINRRPLLAVFTLEDSQGTILGRVSMEVKICSCPGRDRPKEERKRRQETPEARSVPLPRKRHRDENAGQGYKFLRVKEENYPILSKINDALNLASLATNQQRSQYQEEEQTNGWKEQLAKFCRDSLL